jgi:hypothetical protein
MAFTGQLCSVIAAGFAARLRDAMTETAAQLVLNALAWAAAIATAGSLVGRIATEIRWGGTGVIGGTVAPIALPAVFLILFTMRRTRMSGLVGLGWIVFSIANRPGLLFLPILAVQYAVPLAGFAALVLFPQRVATRGRWLWLIPAAVIAFVEVVPGSQIGVLFIAPVVVALGFLPFKPSFALGAAFVWSPFAMWYLMSPYGGGIWTAFSVELLACSALAVIAAGLGRVLAARSPAKTTPLG